MAALVEGHQYALSSISSTSADKTVIHLKLTDSALKAIEECIKVKESGGASIQFLDDHGSITIPVSKSSSNQDGNRTFSFTMSNIPMDPKGSFDCVQQRQSSYEPLLQCLGPMSSKIVVKASDDIYKTTRDRMALAEVESKKNCAKEIKPGGPNSGSRIKKVLKHNHHHSHHHKGLPVKPVPQALRKPIVTPSSRLQTTGGSSSHSSMTGSSNPRPTAAVAPTPSQISHSTPGSTSSSISSLISKPSPAGNQAILNMPYRERIIHLLAVRPYKKPELIARLNRDGVKDKDKKSLGTVLHKVATFNPRDNTFTLAKTLYSEIRGDWPFYSETDRTLLKRRKPVESSQTTPTASPSPVPSPTTSIGSQNSTGCSPTNSQKRPSSTNYESGPPKKQRIAHDRRDRKMKEERSKEKALEKERQMRIKEEKEAERERHLRIQEEREAEKERQMKIMEEEEEAEKERQMKIKEEEAEKERHMRIKEKEAEKERHRIKEEAEKERHMRIKEEKEAEKERHRIKEEAEKERLMRIKEEKEVEKEKPTAVTNGKNEVSTTTPDSSHHRQKHRTKHKDTKKYSPHSRHKTDPLKMADSIKKDSPTIKRETLEKSPEKSVASSTSETPAYVMKYAVIRNHDQRQKYKQDFNNEYGDYINLHASIAKVSNKFSELEATLNKAEKGSEDYENVKNKIVNEYMTIKQDPKYLEQKKRCQYLHEKLAHIKKLIIEYDQSHLLDS